MVLAPHSAGEQGDTARRRVGDGQPHLVYRQGRVPHRDEPDDIH
jgi:hypothetical protein